MRIEYYNDTYRARWDDYVKHSEEATIYHQIGWKYVIEKTFGHKPHYLMAIDGEGVKGILPLFFISSRLFGAFMISLPFHCVGGVCADNEAAEQMLVEEAIRLTKETHAEYLELRQSVKVDIDCLHSKENKVTFVTRLDRNPEVVWKERFCSNLRNKIRKALKADIKVVSGTGKEFIDTFYSIFAKNMRDLGTPVISKKLIKNIIKEFPVNSRIFIADNGGTAIGGKFVMYFKDTAYFIWASSLRSYSKLAPVSLLNWEAIKHACQEGYKYCDFGRSSVNDGSYKYKKQFGGDIKQLYWQHYLNTRDAVPDLSVGNGKFKLAIEAWKRIPVSLTKLIGPQIVKYIP